MAEHPMCPGCDMKWRVSVNRIFTSTNRKDICDESRQSDYPMCPRCDVGCPYWPLYDTCIYTKVKITSGLFLSPINNNNPATNEDPFYRTSHFIFRTLSKSV